MDSLPPELVSHIATFLPAEKKSAYATISKSWQAVIEAHTFKSLNVRRHDVTEFQHVFRTTARRCALVQLEWNVTLSSTHTSAIKTREQRNADAEEFTGPLISLLEELARWEQECNAVKVKIAPALTITIVVVDSDSEDAACDEVDHNPLSLQHESVLPLIHRLVDLNHSSISPRVIDGPSIARIAATFRNIECLNIRLYDDGLDDIDLRRQQRHETATQLSNVSTAHLSDFRLELMHTPTRNEDFRIQSALSFPNGPDHLSEAIHALSLAPNMKKMYINGSAVISSALFWPVNEVKIAPHWPHLEWLEVTFDMKTPDGGWYLLPGSLDENEDEDDDDEESEESDEDDDEDGDSVQARRDARALAIATGQYPDNPIRTIPNASVLHPLFLSAARAASRMPKLRFLSLRMKFTNSMRAPCEMVFAGPGVPHWHDEKVVDEGTSVEGVRQGWRMFWNVKGLGMEEGFKGIWKGIGEERGVEIRLVDLSGN